MLVAVLGVLLLVSLVLNVKNHVMLQKEHNRCSYWRKQYENNQNCKAYDSMVKSQAVLEEAYYDLSSWYKDLTTHYKELSETYNALAEQNEVLIANTYEQSDLFNELTDACLGNRGLYDILLRLAPDLFEGLYVTERRYVTFGVNDDGTEFIDDREVPESDEYYLHPDDLRHSGAKFYFDYANELEDPIILSYM